MTGLAIVILLCGFAWEWYEKKYIDPKKLEETKKKWKEYGVEWKDK